MITHRVTVQLQAPSGSDTLGEVTEGFYILDGANLIMTFASGEAVDPKRFRHILKPDDNPEAIARVYTKQIRLERLGMDAEAATFRRKLSYRDQGQA